MGQIPSRHADIPELGYLAGHTLGGLLDIDQRATAGALAVRSRLNATPHVDAVDAWHLGALMQTFALATAYAGSCTTQPPSICQRDVTVAPVARTLQH